MKFLVILAVFLNCNVLSRHINKRSLLGGSHHHHEEPSDVYLPPPSQEAVVEVTEKAEEITTAAPVAAVKPAESYLVKEEATTTGFEEEISVPDVEDLKSGQAESVEPVETEAPAAKPAETYIVAEEIVCEVETEAPVADTEAPIVEIAKTYLVGEEAAVVEPVEPVETEALAVKPAETYLVAEEVVSEASAIKSSETGVVEGFDETLALAAAESVAEAGTEAPAIQPAEPQDELAEPDVTDAPAIQPAETYIVAEEVETEASAIKSGETSVVEGFAETLALAAAESVAEAGNEATAIQPAEPQDELAEPVVTEAPAIKPAETYIVAEEVETEASAIKSGETDEVEGFAETLALAAAESVAEAETEAPAIQPADTYLVSEDITSKEEEVTPEEVLEDEIEVEKSVEQVGIAEDGVPTPKEEVAVIEPFNNSVEPAIVEAKHANGYWIEVSGDKDVLVKYHA